MNRRKFVANATVITLGLSSPAFGLASGTVTLQLKAEEQEMLGEFHDLLREYDAITDKTIRLSHPQKINHSIPGALDFIDGSGNRISLKRVKGRLVARLH